MEVAAALGTAEGVLEANVYGVEVPGYSGRAGMAAIVVSDKVNSGSGSMALAPLVAAIYEAALALPAYARPLFLRIVPQLETTGTFKQTKTELRAQGYDKAKCGDDPLFFLDGMSQVRQRLRRPRNAYLFETRSRRCMCADDRSFARLLLRWTDVVCIVCAGLHPAEQGDHRRDQVW